MIRFFLSFFIFFSFLYGIENIDKKIRSTKKILNKKQREEIKIKKTLKELRRQLASYQDALKRIDRDIKEIEADLKRERKNKEISQKKYEEFYKKYQSLLRLKNRINEDLVKLLSKEITLNVLFKNSNNLVDNKTKLIQSYIYKTYSDMIKNRFDSKKMQLFRIKIDLASKKQELKNIAKKIKDLNEKTKKLKKLKKASIDGVRKVDRLKRTYRKKLAQIRRENKALATVLRDLKILKRKEKEKDQNTITLKPSANDEINVKRVGDSYSRSPVITYSGPKTIAPFKNYKVIRKFGNSFDPIYKIKMFNPNVILKPIGSKEVRNVLDGVVKSVTKAPSIGNIIIIENKNGIHTLYAKISQIPSYLKKGVRVKKGYILGRVKDELYFEVTKDNANINPLELIR